MRPDETGVFAGLGAPVITSVCPDISDVLSLAHAGGCHFVDDVSVEALGVGALFDPKPSAL